ncbi:ferredoxin [Streptomyces sp. NPDC088725]|uniref:ferredoxin n=1 Tax=Streptomyces sp. NPDC088725 TaxID=3365873 RepID=UPI0038222421
MRIDIDENKCCAAGQCVLAADDLFDQRDEDGVVVLLDATPPEDALERAREAAALCPAAAIEIHV